MPAAARTPARAAHPARLRRRPMPRRAPGGRRASEAASADSRRASRPRSAACRASPAESRHCGAIGRRHRGATPRADRGQSPRSPGTVRAGQPSRVARPRPGRAPRNASPSSDSARRRACRWPGRAAPHRRHHIAMTTQRDLIEQWRAHGYRTGMASETIVSPPPQPFVRAYHMMTTHWAIVALTDSRLKVSRFGDLNDPFELMAINCHTPESRRSSRRFREDFGSSTGLLCFGRDWSSPVMWSHYGDKHRGICLGFDLPRDRVQEASTRMRGYERPLGQVGTLLRLRRRFGPPSPIPRPRIGSTRRNFACSTD
jgi:Protein of unknown function (DUF2971)